MFSVPDYGNDWAFQLQFLKAKNADPQVAAVGMATHFKQNMELFGEDKVGQEIELSNLDEDDMQSLNIWPSPGNLINESQWAKSLVLLQNTCRLLYKREYCKFSGNELFIWVLYQYWQGLPDSRIDLAMTHTVASRDPWLFRLQ